MEWVFKNPSPAVNVWFQQYPAKMVPNPLRKGTKTKTFRVHKVYLLDRTLQVS